MRVWEERKLLLSQLGLADGRVRVVRTLTALMTDSPIVKEVDYKIVQSVVRALERVGPKKRFLKLLHTILFFQNVPIKQNQVSVMRALLASEDVLHLYTTADEFSQRRQMMQREEAKTNSIDELKLLVYHAKLVELLGSCAVGRNAYAEIQCRSLISLKMIALTLRDASTTVAVRCAFTYFLYHVSGFDSCVRIA